MDFSPKIPTKGEISDPIAKYITPKMPEAAPAPPHLKLITTLKPAVCESPIIEQ